MQFGRVDFAVFGIVIPVDRYWDIPCPNRRKAANNEGISLREPRDDCDTCYVVFDRIVHVSYHNSWCTCRNLYLWYTVLAYHCLLRDSLSICGAGFRSRVPRCRYLEFLRGKLIGIRLDRSMVRSLQVRSLHTEVRSLH